MTSVEIRSWRRLAAAIILEAILEYKECLRALETASSRKRVFVERKLREIEEFFLSPECDLYAGYENAGEMILSRIEEIDAKDIVSALCAD